MRFRQENEEVYYLLDPLARIGATELDFLRAKALGNRRGRARLCAHPDAQSRSQDMFVALARGAYARPHRHLGKSEGVFMLEGELLVLTFDDQGQVLESFTASSVQAAQAGRPGATAFFRAPRELYHVYSPLSDLVVFHETTAGPFDPANTIPAPWAPAEDDPAAGLAYLAGLSPVGQSFSR